MLIEPICLLDRKAVPPAQQESIQAPSLTGCKTDGHAYSNV